MMFRYFGRLLCISLTAWLLISCQTKVGMAQLTAQTFISAPSPTYTNAPVASGMLTPTPSPISAQVATLLPLECARLDINVYADFLWQYGDKGCKLPSLSPDGKYLVYVTLTRQDGETDSNFVDTVRMLKVGSDEKEREVRIVPRLDYIGMLEWSATGQLIIWESIWEGSWVIFIYDPATDKILTKMRADQNANLQWNLQHTAFYVMRDGGYGADNCVKELGGLKVKQGCKCVGRFTLMASVGMCEPGRLTERSVGRHTLSLHKSSIVST